MPAGIKANSDGSAAIQVGGTDVITLTSGGAATFVTSPTTVQAGTAAAPSITFSGDTNTGIYSPGADQVAIATGGSQRVTADASGNLNIVNGNLVIGTAGKGIDFSADPSAAGMTSELLDDYEEGTFTPTIAFGGSSTGITYNGTFTSGSYTKIGNTVYVRGSFVLTNKGSATGDASIGGLPFTASGTPAAYIASWSAITYAGMITAYMSGTSVFLQQVSTAGVNSPITNTNFANTSESRFAFSYTV